MAEVVLDTNVAVVANSRTSQASEECIESCALELLEIRENHQLVLDDRGLILEEYRRRLSPSGQPGVGDAFFKWLWDNQGNPDHCLQIPVTPGERGFVEFPDDPDLARFDWDDRKFVAVVIACGKQRPPVLNASDTDWWHFKVALRRHGVEVRFLCPELMTTGTKSPGRK